MWAPRCAKNSEALFHREPVPFGHRDLWDFSGLALPVSPFTWNSLQSGREPPVSLFPLLRSLPSSRPTPQSSLESWAQ